MEFNSYLLFYPSCSKKAVCLKSYQNKARKQYIKNFYYQILAIIILCCVGVLIYSDTFHAPFHFDDSIYITNNYAIRNISNLGNIWGFAATRFIAILSFALSYHFSQLDVFFYHIFNLAIHLGAGILVFWLTCLILSTPVIKKTGFSSHYSLIALFAALIFVSHPIQTESVTYISQRAGTLAGFFYLLSLCLYVKSRLLQADDKPISKWAPVYGFSYFFCIASMFTKENAATLPLILILCEFCFFKKEKNNYRKYALYFLVTLLIVPVLLFFTKPITFVDIEKVISQPMTGYEYFLTQLRVEVTYIRLLFMPLNQNLDYDYAISKSLAHLPTLASLLFLISIFIIAIRVFNKHRLISFSIFWFFLTLLPESSFIPLKDVIFEHRLYLPMVGYSLFIASLIYYRFGAENIKPMAVILVMLVVCYSMFTYSRNYIWKSDFRLWNDAVLKSPQKARPYIYRGDAYSDMGYIDEAIRDYTKAIELKPNLVIGYYNRGNAYSKKDFFDEAIADYTNAINLNPKAAKSYHNRAVAHFYKKEYDKSWDDAHKTQILGYTLKPGFLEALEKASGFQK